MSKFSIRYVYSFVFAFYVSFSSLTLMTTKRSNIKMLRLSLKCVIINDVEDIQTDNLACIVGHPNLSKYIHITDPLFGDTTTEEFLKKIANCEYRSSTSIDQISSSRHYNTNPTILNSITAASASNKDDDDEENNANNDFHLYQFRNISLKKKEKLLVPVFDIEIPYREFYRCKIDQTQQYNKYDSTNEVFMLFTC